MTGIMTNWHSPLNVNFAFLKRELAFRFQFFSLLHNNPSQPNQLIINPTPGMIVGLFYSGLLNKYRVSLENSKFIFLNGKGKRESSLYAFYDESHPPYQRTASFSSKFTP